MSAWMTRSRRRIVLRILLVLLPFLVATTGPSKAAATQSWPFWEKYSARFISPDGRVIDPEGDNRTTSEGQSYALFFALVNNNRPQFDKLLAWTQANLAGGDLSARLPAWLWGKAKDGQWKVLDQNPASDSDCWIAYDLVEAGRLWKNPKYTGLGRTMMGMIADQEVLKLPGFGLMLMPGPSAYFTHGESYILNPSYVPHFLFARFAAVDPAGPWGGIASNILPFLKDSARNGFAMDWVNYTSASGFTPSPGPAPPQPGQVPPPPLGSYDAIRVYLWAGMENPGGPTRENLVAAVMGMANVLSIRSAPPEKVTGDGKPVPGDGPVGFSASVLPYLRTLPQAANAVRMQEQRVAGQLDPTTGLYGKVPAYYDQNLILFANGFHEQRYSFGPYGELKVQWAH